MNIFLHYLGLAIAIALGAILRFWHLDLKPLWLDEVITALFSLGRNYNHLPLEVWFPLEAIQQIFTLNPKATCPQIALNLATQSTHPPLFFCLMHSWIKVLSIQPESLRTVLRSLPALFGVAAIAAIYFLNRIAFSKSAGLMAATLMAVSPFSLYLSQEARHYTLPILLITLALLGLVQIQQDIQRQQWRLMVWFGWVAVNSIGFYVHYFFILSFIAQLMTIAVLFYQTKPKKFTTIILQVICFLLPFIFFIPWLPILLKNAGGSDSDWMPPPYSIAPIYQTLVAGLLMVIALPVENQPLMLAIPIGLLMILFGAWLGLRVFRTLKKLWKISSSQLVILTFLSYTIGVLTELFAIVYLLGKDLTIAPRYNFIYYPAICALIGFSFSDLATRERQIVINERTIQARNNRDFFTFPIAHFWRSLHIKTYRFQPIRNIILLRLKEFLFVFLIGLISCIFVTSGLVFQKPYNPQKVAQDMNSDPAVPLMLMVAYHNYQDIALGLSFSLALDQLRKPTLSKATNPGTYLAFLKRSLQYESVWQKLSQMELPITSQFNLWIVASGLKQLGYPSQINLSHRITCKFDPEQYYRVGISYQLYHCQR